MIQSTLRKLTVGEHLAEEEIFDIIGGIRNGEITDVQTAGFLVALLMKGPTPVKLLRSHALCEPTANRYHPRWMENLSILAALVADEPRSTALRL